MLEPHPRWTEKGVGARERIMDAAYRAVLKARNPCRGDQRGARACRPRDREALPALRHEGRAGLAFLGLREQCWTKDFVEAGALIHQAQVMHTIGGRRIAEKATVYQVHL